MSQTVKRKRGTTLNHASYVGVEGEITVDIDKDTAVVHDGTTAGGHPLAKETVVNALSATVTTVQTNVQALQDTALTIEDVHAASLLF